MRTIFEEAARAEVIRRIALLHKGLEGQWGKMNVYQMARHCNIWNDWILGQSPYKYKQQLIGLIFGKLALKGIVKNDNPLKRNMPAGSSFTVKEKEGDLENQKKQWTQYVMAYEQFSNPGFIHDFFGKMTREEIGILAYKHFDHHLRQFGV